MKKIKKVLWIFLIFSLLFLLSCKNNGNINDERCKECDNCDELINQKEEEIKKQALIELYEEYKNNHPNYDKTYEEWINDLNNKAFSDCSYYISLSGEKSIYVGYGTQLYPNIDNVKLNWTSLNPEIAKVSENGYVQGLSKGFATIKASSNDNIIIGYGVVEVKDEPLAFQNNINLGGYTINIMVAASQFNIFDPFNEYYDYPDKLYKQASLKQIESKYNCKINCIEMPVRSMNVCELIKESIDNNNYLCDIAYTQASLIHAYVYNDLILNISDLNNKYKNDISNRMTYDDFYVDGSLYLISDANKYYNENLEGLVYNKTMLDELGLDNPSKLFNEGKWTYDRFIKWLQEAKIKLGEKIVITTDGLSLYRGLENAKGYNIFNDDLYLNMNNIYDSYEYITSLYYDGYVSSTNFINRRNNDFISGNALMVPSSVFALSYESYYGFTLEENNTSFGFVPYPYPNNYERSDSRIGYCSNGGFVFVKNTTYNDNLNNEMIYQVFYDYLLTSIKNEEKEQGRVRDITYNYLKDVKKLDEESIKTILYYDKSMQIFESCSNYFENEYLLDSFSNIFDGSLDIEEFINGKLKEYYNKVDEFKKGVFPKAWELHN